MQTIVPFKAVPLSEVKPGSVFFGRMFRGEIVRFLRVLRREGEQVVFGVVAIGPYWADENIAHYYQDATLSDIDCFCDESGFVSFSVAADYSENVSNAYPNPGSVYVLADGSIWLTIKTGRYRAFVNVATGQLEPEINFRSGIYLHKYELVRTNSDGEIVVVFDSQPQARPIEVAA